MGSINGGGEEDPNHQGRKLFGNWIREFVNAKNNVIGNKQPLDDTAVPHDFEYDLKLKWKPVVISSNGSLVDEEAEQENKHYVMTAAAIAVWNSMKNLFTTEAYQGSIGIGHGTIYVSTPAANGYSIRDEKSMIKSTKSKYEGMYPLGESF